jgi:hypothetical protein
LSTTTTIAQKASPLAQVLSNRPLSKDGILLKSDFDEKIVYFLLPSMAALSQDSVRFRGISLYMIVSIFLF